MMVRVSLLTFIAAATTASVATAQAFRADVHAVRVDVFVGRGDRAIQGLTAGDFELYDNGVLQAIEIVETRSVPVNVLLLLDTSHSVRGEKLQHLKTAASLVLAELEPKDGAALVTFSSVVRVTGFDETRDRLQAALAASSGFGSTSLNDGLFAALKLAEPVEHPAIVLFTDGEDRFSWLTEDAAYEAAKHNEAAIFVVAGQRGAHSQRLELANHFLRELTATTGGEFFEASTPERLPEIFENILAQLKTRYVLTYLLDGEPAPGWHELDVRLAKRTGAVRARRGYYYEERRERSNE